MSIGDQADVFARLKSTLPRWFSDSTPIVDAVFQGLAWAGSFVYSLYAYAKLQTRIKTATDGWLDIIRHGIASGGQSVGHIVPGANHRESVPRACDPWRHHQGAYRSDGTRSDGVRTIAPSRYRGVLGTQ